MLTSLRLTLILIAIFFMTAGLCCTHIDLEINSSDNKSITIVTDDTIPKRYNKFYIPTFDTTTKKFVYIITDGPLRIYSVSCTKTNHLSEEIDNIEKNLPINYLQIIKQDKTVVTASSKKEISDLFKSGANQYGELSY